MQTIELKTAPEIKALVTAAFPGYKKHNVFLSVFSEEYGHSINSYWDGGSRDTYTIVEIGTGRRKALPTSSHPYYDVARQGLADAESADVVVDHVGNVTLKRLPDGLALVQGGTFCGKTATAHVFIPAANMARLIEGKTKAAEPAVIEGDRVAITGNTYPCRFQFRQMGGQWDADVKAWMVPAAKADEARALLTAR